MLKLYIFMLILLPVPALAQTQADGNASQNIIDKLQGYSAKHVVEKAYLQFDKPYYAAGDTIFFKAYLTLGATHELSALSGVLYAELVDNITGKIKQHENLELSNGVAWGDFALPDSLPKSSYSIRAYTQLMRNEGEDSFFKQNIPIAAVVKSSAVTTTLPATTAAKPDIHFFPEGGTLVTGVRSKIAFKATGANGLGINVNGEVLDNDNKPVCTFAAAHLGMGYFYLTPEAGKTYTAKLSYRDGSQDAVALPAPDDNGIGMAVTNDSTLVVSVGIMAGKACYQTNKGKTYILSVYTGGTLTNIPCRLDSSVVTAILYKRRLHTGITRLTLFSPAGEPICERLVFVQNYDQLNLSLSSDKPGYGIREKVSIKLTAADKKGGPVSGDFSVAVTDEGKVPVDVNSENTILNSLLLTSELKGNIEQPNYYFADSSYTAYSNLDLLMLTQGYRGFVWKQVLGAADTAQPKYQPEKLLSLAGTVETLEGKPVPRGSVTLASIRQMIARDTTADANGNFKFDNLDITDTTTLLLRAGNGRKNQKTAVLRPDYPVVSPISSSDTVKVTNPAIAAAIGKQVAERRGNMKTGIILKQVEIKRDNNPLRITHLTHSDNLNGPGVADQVIMGDQLVGCVNISDCLAFLLRGGVRLVGSPPTIYSTHTPIGLNGRTKPMAVQLDGVMEGQDALSMVSPADIYSIEMLENHSYSSIYGSEGYGGVIVITTRRGDERNLPVTIQPGLTTYTFKGFYKAREFYSPKYTISAPANKIPDLRSTIFWKPVVLTDKDGNASFDFYNADGAGTYRVVIEGIDAKGNIGRQVYRYTVE
jgi:hypothetical protein